MEKKPPYFEHKKFAVGLLPKPKKKISSKMIHQLIIILCSPLFFPLKKNKLQFASSTF